MKPPPGSRIEMHWPIDNASYPGTVSTIDSDDLTTVQYDDGEIEQNDNMNKEEWRFANSYLQKCMKTSSLWSIEQVILDGIFVECGNKPSSLHSS